MALINTTEITEAISWKQAMRIARERRYGTKVEVKKLNEPRLPPGFDRSRLSIPAGAEVVYRDTRQTDSYQIRDFGDRWTIEMDRFNPEQGSPIAHAVADAPKYTLAAMIMGAAAVSGFNS